MRVMCPDFLRKILAGVEDIDVEISYPVTELDEHASAAVLLQSVAGVCFYNHSVNLPRLERCHLCTG